MKRPSVRTLRRSALALGLAGAATIGATAASQAASGSPAASARVPACATSQLTVWWGEPGDAAAGSSYVPLEFSNTGTTTCNLYGYPGVSTFDTNGHQLGSAASWDHSVTPTTVVLTPGSTAHAWLRITDVYNYPPSVCGPVASSGLRIYPPNQKAALELPLAPEACSKAGPIYLQVRPVMAGAGIPGHP
jgi:hypothetical protein